MLKKIGRTFFRGIMILVPAACTAYVVYLAWHGAEGALKPEITRWLDEKKYLPGMSVVLMVVIVFIVGMLWNFWLFRRGFRLLEKAFDHIPLVKTLYGAVRDMLGLFQGSESPGMNQVVMVDLGSGKKVMGFVTREEFSDLPAGIGEKDSVAVYISMSYNLGGFTLTVPRSALQRVDMSVEDAMRYAITAGVPPKRLETMVRRKPPGPPNATPVPH